jgi:hypothetical protein
VKNDIAPTYYRPQNWQLLLGISNGILQNTLMKRLPVTLKFLLLPAIAVILGFTVRALLAEEKLCTTTDINMIAAPVILDFGQTPVGVSSAKFQSLCEDYSYEQKAFCATYKPVGGLESPIRPGSKSADDKAQDQKNGASKSSNTAAPSPPPAIVGAHVSQRVGFADLQNAKTFLDAIKMPTPTDSH